MAIKLHTCGNTWIHGPHPCWKVMKALDDAGIPYEHVKHPSFPRGRRDELEALSGQRILPVVEFENGQTLREESSVMAARIKEGRLTEGKAQT
jgi:glutathione S-transferase